MPAMESLEAVFISTAVEDDLLFFRKRLLKVRYNYLTGQTLKVAAVLEMICELHLNL